jgi:hypothetical protein
MTRQYIDTYYKKLIGKCANKEEKRLLKRAKACYFKLGEDDHVFYLDSQDEDFDELTEIHTKAFLNQKEEAQ